MRSFSMMDESDNVKQIKFLNTAEDVALLLGIAYSDIKKIFYETSKRYQYRKFTIPKKNGGERTIYAPNRKIREIQRILADILIEIYEQKPAVHGFSKGKSIVTNAKQHLNKKHIFNIDLKDFFPSIHFGRVKNLFQKSFNIPHAPATVLAHICCFERILPQGAPTSPIITNMICRKLDTELQKLAKRSNCTYTRYADDISFSFTCARKRLPNEIVIDSKSGIFAGTILTEIINKNGFQINETKVRLNTTGQRLEVTGLSVNQFPNVRRSYVQQIKSMLYAWEKHGYKAAEKEYQEEYFSKNRASKSPPKFLNLLKGKLAFLHMVRGKTNPIYVNLAKRFNILTNGKARPLPFEEITDGVSRALWVLEAVYDDPEGNVVVNQGTGFWLKDIGLITCAHVVAVSNSPLKEIKAFRWNNTTEQFDLKVINYEEQRDLAICELSLNGKRYQQQTDYLLPSYISVELQETITLYGFPSYKLGQTPYIATGQVASKYSVKTIKMFDIDKSIGKGCSGGPILNIKKEVVGIAVKGAESGSGNNAAIKIEELIKFFRDPPQYQLKN